MLRADGGTTVISNSLMVQMQAVVTAHAPLHASGRLPAAARVALRYRFAGELVDVDEVLARGG
jgi:hypothetical protein